MRTPWMLLLVLGLAVTGCRKPQPSLDYQQAQTRFVSLYAQKLDDAYGDPEMEQILAQLRRVPKDSRDWKAAQDLIARIEQGRSRLLAERQAPTAPAPAVPVVPTAPSPTPTPAVEPPDAGLSLPRVGMSRADFEKQFGRCFRTGETVYLNNREPAESRVMLQLTECRMLLPNFENLVILKGDSVVAVVDPSSLTRRAMPADGGAPSPTDGGR